MDNEDNSAFNTVQDNNTTVEKASVLKILRNERNDILKEKFENDFSLNNIQETIKTQEQEMQRVLEWQSKLNLQNRQLKEAVESENHNKLILENDFENMNRRSEMFREQLSQLENTCQAIETNTENIEKSKAVIHIEIANYFHEQKIKQKAYEDEIKNMQTLINTEIEKDKMVIKEMQLNTDTKKNEISTMLENEQELSIQVEKSRTLNSQIETELQKKRADKDNLHNEVEKSQDKYFEISNTLKINEADYETQLETLNTDTTALKESIENIQKNIGSLKQEHNKINEDISQIQSDLNNLESEHCEIEENLTNIISNTNEMKAKACKENEERNSEKLNLQDKLKILTEGNKQVKEFNKNIEMKLEEKKKINNDLNEELFVQKQQQENAIKEIEKTQMKNKENSSDYVKTINEYKNNIKTVELRNIQKKEANEIRNNEVIEKQTAISNVRDNIKTITDKKNNMVQEKISSAKNLKEEFAVAEKDLQSLNSEIQKVTKSIEKEIKSAEKNKRDKINKIEKEMKQFKENMNTTMKNDNDKHIKEKRSLDDSIKAMTSQINEFNTTKEKLQEEIEKINKEILDIKQKKIETMLKKTENETVFKSPISKPKACLKKTVKKPEMLTQKPAKETQNLTTIQSENLDDNFTLTQKTIPTKTPQKPEIKKIKFLGSSELNIPSLTGNSDNLKGDKISAFQKKNGPHINIWPTDNETTDDSFNKNIITSTQKQDSQALSVPVQSSLTQNKRPYEFLDSESTEENVEDNKKFKVPLTQSSKKISKGFWASEEDSDDCFFGKLNKSKKIQSAQKGITNPVTTINLNTSSSD